MSIEIKVTSKRIGGNPGGRCVVSNTNLSFPAYYKFCYGSKLSLFSTFSATNQPVYEAVTSSLARQIGLRTPKTFVLLNPNKDVLFHDWRDYQSSQDLHDPSGRKKYFVSKLVEVPQQQHTADEDARTRAKIEEDRPYLEALLISDIINKKENFVYYNYGEKEQITYLDLGCSFVHAIQGFLTQPHKIRISRGKEAKSVMNALSRYLIISADNNSFIDVAGLIENMPGMLIPTLNPTGMLPMNQLLDASEIETIQRYIIQGFSNTLPEFERRSLLLSK